MNIGDYIPITNHTLVTKILQRVFSCCSPIVCASKIRVFVATKIGLFASYCAAESCRMTTGAGTILCLFCPMGLYKKAISAVQAFQFYTARCFSQFRYFCQRARLCLIGTCARAIVIVQSTFRRLAIKGFAALRTNQIGQRSLLSHGGTFARTVLLIRLSSVSGQCTWESFKLLSTGRTFVNCHNDNLCVIGVD